MIASKNIAIIGAGLSGLTAANILKDSANITLFEKSRGVGGRISTRRFEPYFFDHGAQFFKARTSEFKTFIAPMIEQGIIAPWNARFVEFKDKKITTNRNWDCNHQHYVGVPNMNIIAKYLSNGLNINLETKVKSLTKDQEKWHLIDDKENNLGSYDWVIIAVPPLQAIELLGESLKFFPQIASIKMQSCFSVMLGFEKPLALDFDAAFVKEEDISWISVNSSKPGRNQSFCLVINSTNKWADQHIEDDKAQVMQHLCANASEIINHDLSLANHKAIQAWRYANIDKQEGEANLIDIDNKIALCGDWFIKGQVEAAFTSGFKLAHQIKNINNF